MEYTTGSNLFISETRREMGGLLSHRGPVEERGRHTTIARIASSKEVVL